MADDDLNPAPQATPLSLQSIVNALNQNGRLLSLIEEAIASAFPQATASVTHSATAGVDTLPANPSGFLTITINGVAFKIPLYNA